MTFAMMTKNSAPVQAAKPTFVASGIRIGQPNDSHEQEADRLSGTSPTSGCAGAGSTSAMFAPSLVNDVLNTPGEPLEPAAQTMFEQKFGWNLGHVRVHTGTRAEESANAVDADAYTVGQSVVLGPGADQRTLAHELVHTRQQRQFSNRLQRAPKAAPEQKLLNDFAAKFPNAAALIKPNPAAMKLVKEAFDAGVKFGGYAEDGSGADLGRAYTTNDTVHIPKSHDAIPVLAMSDFLFELNNAIRSQRFTAITAAAGIGSKTDAAAARKYAHDKIELEVEGMLRLGEVWFETKAKYLGNKVHDFDQFDRDFYLAEYKSFKDRKRTKEDIVTNVLQRKYDTGTLKGKTTEQFYMEQYQGIAQRP